MRQAHLQSGVRESSCPLTRVMQPLDAAAPDVRPPCLAIGQLHDRIYNLSGFSALARLSQLRGRASAARGIGPPPRLPFARSPDGRGLSPGTKKIANQISVSCITLTSRGDLLQLEAERNPSASIRIDENRAAVCCHESPAAETARWVARHRCAWQWSLIFRRILLHALCAGSATVAEFRALLAASPLTWNVGRRSIPSWQWLHQSDGAGPVR